MSPWISENPMASLIRMTADAFVREVGLWQEQFRSILENVQHSLAEEQRQQPMKKRGKKSSLSVETRVLLTFEYVRHDPTFAHLAPKYGVSESYACKIYHQMLTVLLKVLPLPSRKMLLNPGVDAIVIDVTEQPLERPVKKQRRFYSGKKKRHTIKAQLIVHLTSRQILSVVCGKGRTHDFKLFTQCQFRILSDLEKYADSGYQGLAKRYAKSFTPIKKRKGRKLTALEKAYNRALARLRIAVEHVNRRCKIFRAVKETYRGKHKNYHKVWTVVAALVNLRYAE